MSKSQTTRPSPATAVPGRAPRPARAAQANASAAEAAKRDSRFLRGTLREELEAGSDRFGGGDLLLLKFHGTYQQDNRDERKLKAKAQRTYSLMVRSRIPGGTLSAAQYRVYDGLADRYGGGALRLTTRQSLQLHGVLKQDARVAMQAIHRALLTTAGACGDVVRNVMLTPDPVPSPLLAELAEAARALSDRLRPASGAYAEVWLDGERAAEIAEADGAEEPLYGDAYLPRKFKIGMTVAGDNSIDAYTQDAAFVAIPDGQGGIAGYDVLAGGGMGMTHRNPKTFPRLADEIGFVPPELLAPTAEAIVAIHRDWGDRADRTHARLKYVLAEQGVEWFRAELERRLGAELAPFRPLSLEAPTWYGWTDMGEGRWSLGLPIPSGRIADLAPGHGRKSFLRELASDDALTFRITPQQHLLVLGVADERRGEVAALAERHGISLDAPPTIGRDALACPALPTCGLALTEAERYLPELSSALEAALEEAYPQAPWPPNVRVTGCPNGCTRPYSAEIGIVGQGPMRFALFLGGNRAGTRLAREFMANVPAAELPGLLGQAFAMWRDTAPQAAFGDFASGHWDALHAALIPDGAGARQSA